MLDSASVLLAALPALVCVSLLCRPGFFDVPAALTAGGLGEGRRGSMMAAVGVGGLAVVPLMLLALAAGAGAAMLFGCVMSFLAAVWGAARLTGLAGAAAAAVLLTVALAGAGSAAIWAANALSFAAGLGGAHLLRAALSPRALTAFMVCFAAVDIAVVSGGLVDDALGQLPLAGTFAEFSEQAPVFNRIEIGDALLGAADITFAALVAGVLAGMHATRAEAAAAVGMYGASMAVLVGAATVWGASMPATVPGIAALAAFAALRRLRAAVAA